MLSEIDVELTSQTVVFLQFSFVECSAARTLTAIPEDEFYVFTHPDMCAGVKERFTAIVAAMARAAR